MGFSSGLPAHEVRSLCEGLCTFFMRFLCRVALSSRSSPRSPRTPPELVRCANLRVPGKTVAPRVKPCKKSSVLPNTTVEPPDYRRIPTVIVEQRHLARSSVKSPPSPVAVVAVIQ
jgi:hypothetical protein